MVLNVTYTKSLKDQLDHMLGALDIVIIVLIISAGMLAFVVLYNLNNININERKRELATIKVLGFYDGEVAAYVYRENILLTIIGRQSASSSVNPASLHHSDGRSGCLHVRTEHQAAKLCHRNPVYLCVLDHRQSGDVL